MTEFSISTPSGQTIFCDDIRSEMGGKPSFMGVYSGAMFINTDFPCVLPKFCIFVQYFEKHGAVIPPLTLQIFLPENDDITPFLSMPIPTNSEQPPIDEMYGDTPLVGMQMPFTFAPFTISHEGAIRVRMLRGEDVVRLGRLVIKSAPQTV